MQDRFKFRAWDIEEDRYASDDDICYDTGGTWDSVYDLLKVANQFYVYEQCTGLKDEKGKLIYEGDILATSPTYSPSYGCYKVFFQKDECSFKAIPCDGSHDYAIPLNVLTKKNDFQIIGNIHENPELLEEDK